ncbi:MAG: low molecular weight protein arginine phosphatase [Tissierellaceae bacterium]|nr:low molecular weight protein arginine phosphatase [Tissierellaceae bacterium]
MNILFVCTGNTCRSPMAEGILKSIVHKEKLDIVVKSAGINTFNGGKASKNSIKAMENIGLDISGHKSRQIDETLIKEADLILTMGSSHRDSLLSFYPDSQGKTFTLINLAYGVEKDVADPYGQSLYVYEHTRDAIQQAILQLLRSSQFKLDKIKEEEEK